MLDRHSESKTISYQVEHLRDCLTEAQALIPAHWEEIASNKHVRRLNPDYEVRFAAERAGRLVIATARDAGRLIGYIVWFVFADPNAKDGLTAETDVYFVEDRPNRALTLRSLMRFSLKRLAKMGVVTARPRTKLKTEGRGRGAGLLWQSLGFQPLEIVYSKTLDAPERE